MQLDQKTLLIKLNAALEEVERWKRYTYEARNSAGDCLLCPYLGLGDPLVDGQARELLEAKDKIKQLRTELENWSERYNKVEVEMEKLKMDHVLYSDCVKKVLQHLEKTGIKLDPITVLHDAEKMYNSLSSNKDLDDDGPTKSIRPKNKMEHERMDHTKIHYAVQNFSIKLGALYHTPPKRDGSERVAFETYAKKKLTRLYRLVFPSVELPVVQKKLEEIEQKLNILRVKLAITADGDEDYSVPPPLLPSEKIPIEDRIKVIRTLRNCLRLIDDLYEEDEDEYDNDADINKDDKFFAQIDEVLYREIDQLYRTTFPKQPLAFEQLRLKLINSATS